MKKKTQADVESYPVFVCEEMGENTVPNRWGCCKDIKIY